MFHCPARQALRKSAFSGERRHRCRRDPGANAPAGMSGLPAFCTGSTNSQSRPAGTADPCYRRYPWLMRFLPWWVCVWAGLSCAASAATVEVGGTTYRIRHWTTEHDLPQNRIGCLKQTLDGYLWIGTWSGLVRFDGVHFTPFNKFNTPELVNDAINTLAQDAGGTLWIGTHDGLVSYREYRFQRFTMADGLPDRNVVQSVNSRSGGVWLQAGDSVVRLDHEKFSESWWLDLSGGGQVLSIHERDDKW